MKYQSTQSRCHGYTESLFNRFVEPEKSFRKAYLFDFFSDLNLDKVVSPRIELHVYVYVYNRYSDWQLWCDSNHNGIIQAPLT